VFADDTLASLAAMAGTNPKVPRPVPPHTTFSLCCCFLARARGKPAANETRNRFLTDATPSPPPATPHFHFRRHTPTC